MKFSDCVDRVARSRMPMVSQRMVWGERCAASAIALKCWKTQMHCSAIVLERSPGEKISCLLISTIAPLLQWQPAEDGWDEHLHSIWENPGPGLIQRTPKIFAWNREHWVLELVGLSQISYIFPVWLIWIERINQSANCQPPQNVISFDRCHKHSHKVSDTLHCRVKWLIVK